MNWNNFAIEVLVGALTAIAMVGTFILLGLKIDVPSQVYDWDGLLVGGSLVALGIKGGVSLSSKS